MSFPGHSPKEDPAFGRHYPTRKDSAVFPISRRNVDQPRNSIVDRDYLLLRMVVLVAAMFAGLGLGKLILDTALTLWGPK